MNAHHAVEDVARPRLVRLLQDALQQERVLGEPLVRLRHHVGQLQTVALLVRLSPLKRGRTKTGNGSRDNPEMQNRPSPLGARRDGQKGTFKSSQAFPERCTRRRRQKTVNNGFAED